MDEHQDREVQETEVSDGAGCLTCRSRWIMGNWGGGAGLGEGIEPSAGCTGSSGQPRLGAEPGSGDRFSGHQAVDGCRNLGHS